MKNMHFKSFLCGVLACLMVVGLCATVTAATTTTTISVSYGTKVLFNGQTFQPKDSAGRSVQLITYNGTVYAPIRAVCEKAGLKVEYDAATKTASIMTADYVPPKPVTPPVVTDTSATIEGVTITGNLGFLQLAFWKSEDCRNLMQEIASLGGIYVQASYDAENPEYGEIYSLSFVTQEGLEMAFILECKYGEPIDFREA